MNPSTGSLRECKTLFDAYMNCRHGIKLSHGMRNVYGFPSSSLQAE